MKSVLISIQPKWCELIASGKKTVEIRKTKPKLGPPFKVYIYCTIGDGAKGDILPQSRVTCGKVIGEFMCENIDYWHISHLVFEQDAKIALKGTCLTKEEVEKYIGYERGKNIWEKPYEFFGWHISDLVIYDQPKDLRDFRTPCKMTEGSCYFCDYAVHGMDGDLIDCNTSLERPPQSWCYVEQLEGD